MTTHEGHDHPATKAARAACRRGQGLIGDRKSANDLPKMPAKEKARIKAGKPKAKATQPEVDHDDQRRDGRIGESRLAHARAACKHPSDKWVLRGATRKRTGTYVCECGQRMGDEGPRDLAAKFRF